MPIPEPAEYFANLPEEFKGDWLTGRVANCRWPAEWHLESWTRVLGEHPARFRLRTWRETEVDVANADWCNETTETLLALRATCLGAPPTRGWQQHLPEARRKTARIAEYAAAHRALPARLMTFRREDGLFLVDGYHRVVWRSIGESLAGAAFPVSPFAKCFEGILP